jgi:3-deoxy-7-phosphoheptulonate synthase
MESCSVQPQDTEKKMIESPEMESKTQVIPGYDISQWQPGLPTGRFLVIEPEPGSDPGQLAQIRRNAIDSGFDLEWRDCRYTIYGIAATPHMSGRRLDDSVNARLRDTQLQDTVRNATAGEGIHPLTWANRPGIKRAWMQNEDYVLAGRHWQSTDTLIKSGEAVIGGSKLAVIAGPCSVEDRQQMLDVAWRVKQSGVSWLRGGAFKPRSNPYHFQGLGSKGLELLRMAADETGLGVITEIMSIDNLQLINEYTDVFQVGSRNAQNFSLLKALGQMKKPVLLKRGFGCMVEELILAAEYLMSHGNSQVMLCERGIRSFERSTRFTFDINALPILKRESHLPVVADPSHGTGDTRLVSAVAKAAIAAGADALMFEVHPEPEKSISDRDQTLGFDAFEQIMQELKPIVKAVGREI